MVERSQHLRLPREACQPIGIEGEGVGDDLQRHVAMQLGIAGAIDLAHAPGTECGGISYGPRRVPGVNDTRLWWNGCDYTGRPEVWEKER